MHCLKTYVGHLLILISIVDSYQKICLWPNLNDWPQTLKATAQPSVPLASKRGLLFGHRRNGGSRLWLVYIICLLHAVIAIWRAFFGWNGRATNWAKWQENKIGLIGREKKLVQKRQVGGTKCLKWTKKGAWHFFPIKNVSSLISTDPMFFFFFSG